MSVAARIADEQNADLSEDNELTRVLADYLAEIEAGNAVDPDEWAQKHPAIADRFRTCLKGLHLVEEFAGSIGAGAIKRSPDAGGARLGDFRIVRTLGRGGMGVVYEAVQVSLDRRVALKVLPLGAAIDPRRLARFRVESQAAAGLHHPHIIPVYSVGSEGGVHYYAMQMIDGVTIAELIGEMRRAQKLADHPGSPPTTAEASSILSAISTDSPAFSREAARLGVQAALALEHAHENGVLHRDVKPSNLIVDGSGHLWVADFGLARFQNDGSLTVSGDVLGTLRYMSPEQALANRAVVDQRTDVYSLGATLYELITLRSAFEGSNRQDLLRRIAQDDPRRPRAQNPAIPIDLETIVMKAMDKDPASRYATAREMADDLERFLNDQPVRARKPAAIERLARSARRHMAIVVAVVPLLFVIVALLALGLLMVLAERSQILSQQSEISKQKFDAEKSRGDARRQRDVARRAVDEMYTLVASEWLNKQTNLQPLQRDFLQKALAYYQEFASEKDTDPVIRIQTAWAFYRLGDIERRLGNLAAGEQGYRKAIETIETLAEGKAMRPELLEPLADSYSVLGELLDETGRTDESKLALVRAIELDRVLIASIPDKPENAKRLADQYDKLGTSLGRNGQHQDAEAAFQKAIAKGPLTDQSAAPTRAHATSNLAITLKKQGKLPEAQRLYRQAIELYGSLAQSDPESPHYKARLADSLLNLGQALPADSKELEAIFRRAAGVYQGLATDAPEVSGYRENLATTLINLANLCAGAGRLREAEAAAREARSLLEGVVERAPSAIPPQELLAHSLTFLAKVHAETGQTAAALAEVQRACDIFDKLKPQSLDLKWKRAWSFANLAQLREVSGELSAADHTRQSAVAAFEGLVSEAPDQLTYRADFAYQLMLLAVSSGRNGRKVEAERDFKLAIESLELVLSKAPERSADRLRMAQAAHNFGVFLFQNQNLAESERLGWIAYRAYERLYQENFQQAAMVRNCADILKNIATSQLGRLRSADAVTTYREAIKLFNSLPPKLALEPTIREALATTHDNLGATLMRGDSPQDAEAHIQKGIKIRESMLAQAPNQPSYQDALGLSKTHLGKILAKRGEASAARRLLEQAVELGRQAQKAEPRNTDSRAHLRGARKALALCLLEARDHVAAAAASEDLLRDFSPDDQSDTRVQAAVNLSECAYLAMHDQSLAPDRRKGAALPYAKRALEAFQQAVESQTTHNLATINLIWFRLDCPIADLGDTALAMRLARDLLTRSPDRPDSWSTLGTACFYSADLKGALSAFRKAREFDKQSYGGWEFFAAMAHWKLGDKQEARSCFDRAQKWMMTNQITDQHRRVRKEAAAVLGLPDDYK
jgi:eukaryotic-like serine/threonine-protein kinase